MPHLGFGIIEVIWIALIAGFWILILAGLFLGVRWLLRADRNSRLQPPPAAGMPPPATATPATPEDPLEVLRLRYARGEIDEDEYQRRRSTLTGG
ncbi:MAG TPA: SHOCT domain-containing protein [Candidatus Limnocylindrales bacterium]